MTTGKGKVDLKDSNIRPMEIFMCSVVRAGALPLWCGVDGGCRSWDEPAGRAAGGVAERGSREGTNPAQKKGKGVLSWWHLCAHM